MSLSSLWESFKHGYTRFEFNSELRTDFYEQITQLYGNGIKLEEAMKRIYLVASDGKPNPTSATAVVARECIAGLTTGGKFADVIGKWVSADEASVIAAGEDAGQILEAFKRVNKSMKRRKKLIAGVWIPLALPTMLMVVIFGILIFSAFYFCPQLLTLAPLDAWKGLTYDLMLISGVIGDWWWLMVGSVIAGIIFFVWSLGRWRGGERDWVAIKQEALRNPDYVLPMTLRDRFDKFAPYSIYRIYMASVFIDNVVQMQSQGLALPQTLESIRRFASPWLQEKIDDTLWGVNRGLRLGDALAAAGHHFPDKGTISFLQVLEEADSTGAALEKFSGRWIKRNTVKVGQAARWLRIICMLAAGLILALFYGAVYGISQMSTGR